ncbi:hypothetical protein BH10BAC3_BH10BAC3_27630 [soil metagenome]
MNKRNSFFNNCKWPLSGLLLTVVLFTACKKDKTEFVQPPAAGLMAFNLAADKPAVGFSLSNNPLGNAALNYTGFTGTYLPIFIGEREVRTFDYTSGATIATANQDFKDSAYYSAFLIGANGTYRNLVVTDNFADVKPAAGKAWVRFINAIPDSTATTTVTIGEANENAAYASVSAFKQANAGDLNVAVSNGSTINKSRTINLEENKIYTVLFVGLPNQTDSTKAVQIRYIQNGTATE